MNRFLQSATAWQLLAAALLVFSAASQAPILLDHDVAYFLHSASRLLEGASLYRDIIDPNPPAIFFLNLPPAALARLTGMPGTAVFKGYVVFLILVSMALSAGALRRLLADVPAGVRAALHVALLILLFPAAKSFFGQREHLMLILILPYVLYAASEDRRLSFLVGILAGLGLVIKPFFLAVWLLVELYLLFTRGVSTVWRRRENWGIASVQGLNLVYILFGVPEYYRQVIPLARTAYRLASPPLQDLFLREAALPLAIAAVVLFVIPPTSQLRALRHVVALAFLGVLAAALMQQKGFAYHFYPARAFVALLFALAGLDLVLWIPAVQQRFWRVFLVTAAGAAFVVAHQPRVHPHDAVARLIPLVREQARGEPVALFSLGERPAFPTVNYAAARWDLRYSSLWLLPSFYEEAAGANPRDRYRAPAQMAEAERFFFDGVVADLLKAPPRLLMIHCGTRSIGRGEGSFDVAEYFAQDSRLRALWQNYDYLTTIECIRILRRR